MWQAFFTALFKAAADLILSWIEKTRVKNKQKEIIEDANKVHSKDAVDNALDNGDF